MSTDQNAIIHNGPPKRFLRKGEGLKRFAAYKPPLPGTVKKVERRQTFVRFRMDQAKTITRREPAHFIPPEILNDDSINLSTEIPKIAPPKIIHTPIRPSRHALGTLTNETSLFSDSHINVNIDKLFKKIEEKKSNLDGCKQQIKQHEHHQPEHEDNNQASFEDNQDEQEYHDNYTPPPSPPAPVKAAPSKARKVNQVTDLSKPLPGNCMLAFTKQLQQIEATINELRDKIKNCECGAITPPSPPKTRRRPTTRAAAKAAQSKPSDKPRPSADADNPTTKMFNSLTNQVAELKAAFAQFNLN